MIRKLLFCLLLFLGANTRSGAQAPEAINYQAVARDAGGQALPNQLIGVHFLLHQGTSNGTVVYGETQQTSTNALGLFTLELGNGTPTLGQLSLVDWSAGPYFLEVDLDPAGGTNYSPMGTNQLLSVPYALYAASTPCFTVSTTGDTLFQGNGCFVIIPGISAANQPCTDADVDGWTTCAGDCDDTNSNIFPGAPELCDGLDNDCDGQVDEGNPDGGIPCNTGLPGVCATGTTVCQNGILVCVPVNAPSVEVCDGLDNDCDGQVDEGNPDGGIPCNTGLPGVCATGTTVCQNGVLVCVPVNAPSVEVCDGLDNDCDGQVDEGNPDGGIPCNTGLPGVCATGTTVCQNGILVCVPVNAPSAEVCDGLDNDCDGQVDEDFNFQTDPNNCGACGTVCVFPNATAQCANGVCSIAFCAPGFADCDGNPANGCEVNLGSDPSNCGACGAICPQGTSCVNGSCM